MSQDASPLMPENIPPTPPTVQPVQPVMVSERIQAIDVLRGLALLGILPVNIIAFAHVGAAYQNPTVAGGHTGINYLTWLFTHLIFESKMVTLFSMLFGVGLFIQVDRAEKRRGRPGSARGLYFRRVGWLLLFGLIHGYVFWFGDILTYYAVMGMLIYWLRRLKPRTLVIIGVILLLLGSAVLLGVSYYLDMAFNYVKEHPEKVEEAREIRKMQDEFSPSPEKVEADAKKVRDAGFIELARMRAGQTLQFQIMGFVTFVLWRISAMMLFGIALYKWGVFSLNWSDRSYWRWVLYGLGIGTPLMIMGIVSHHAQGGMVQMLSTMATYDYFGSLFMAAGYLGLMMLLVKNHWLPALTSRLAAVGQMAFTNYLSQTLICTAIFHGWGLGQFGYWPRYALFLLVVGIWLLQLLVSPLWLRHFYFGPGEWLWRSLTYLKWQPMRRKNMDVNLQGQE